MNKNNKIIYLNHINMISLNMIAQISSGKTNINMFSEQEKSFLLKFLLVSLGIDTSTTVEEMLVQENEMNTKRINNELLIFENNLKSLPDIDNYEPVIKMMESTLLDNDFYAIFSKKICNYFTDLSYSEGIIIFLSNIFEPSIRKKVYLFFWNIVNSNKAFTREYGKDFFNIIKAITFNEKEINEFECLLSIY